MDKETFIDRTLNRLFETFMPPGMEEARVRLEERLEVPQSVERAAWNLYEYSSEDRELVAHKLRAAAREVVLEATKGVGQVELGLVASESSDAELERTFRGSDKSRALRKAIEWADTEGYSVEEPPEGSESASDYRIDGRRLTLLRK